MPNRNFIQKIPVSKTFLPLDPAGFRRNLPGAVERQLEEDIGHTIYDAANIMPTAQGYSSYFGKRFVCDGVLPLEIEDAFVYEDSQANLYLLALGDEGIFYQGADCDTAEFILQGDGFEVTDYETD